MASELDLKITRLDIRLGYLETLKGTLPKKTTDSLIKQVRDVVALYYKEREQHNGKGNGVV